jgi:hypothetical protein
VSKNLLSFCKPGLTRDRIGANRLDADEPEMLLAIAKYVHIDDGPEFAADDLRRLILELSMVTDAIRYAQDALQDRLPEAQRVQDAHEEAHPLSFPQQE